MMNCNDSMRLASARIDSQIAPEEARELEAHLASCPACERGDRAMRAINAGFSTGVGHSVPPGFKSALFERLDAEALLPARKGRLYSFPVWRWGALPVALAAGLALFLLVGREAGEVPSSGRQLARQDVPFPAPAVTQPGAPPLSGENVVGMPVPGSAAAPATTAPVSALSPEEAEIVANLDLIEDAAALDGLPAGFDELLASPAKTKG